MMLNMHLSQSLQNWGKKSSNLIKIGKEKPHCPISYSLACFVEFVGRPHFCFADGLASLIDSLAIGKIELKEGKIAIGFSG